MKKTKMLSAGVLVLAALNKTQAQYAPPPPPAPFAGFANEALKANNPSNHWDLGGDFRVRYEAKERYGIQGTKGSVDFRNVGVEDNNDYYLMRTRVHVGYNEDWWNVFVEARSSIVKSDLRAAYADVPAIAGTAKRVDSGPESDGFNLNQAYTTIGNLKQFPVTLKVGRQELTYGDERLVGTYAWNNIGRQWDALKLHFQSDWVSADAFVGNPVIPHDDQFDNDNPKDTFSGLYATTTKIPKTILEGYFFSRNSERGAISEDTSPQFPQPTARDVYTVGGRLKSKPKELGNFDYTIEGAYQFGDFADPTQPAATAVRLRQDAYMFVVNGGYTFTELWGTPRLGLEYAYGSGDDNSKDGVHGTFDNLYPTNHKFYGSMDLASLQNLQDVRAMFSLKPTKRTSIELEGHGLWLADKNDYFYNVSGAARTPVNSPAGTYGINPGYGNFLGTELVLVGGYALTRNSLLEAGYGHFFTASYIDRSLASIGGSKDADWVYFQATVRF